MDQYTPSKRFRLRGWHIGLLLVIGFVGLVVLFILGGKNRLGKEIAAIRAAGYPTNYEELDKYYSIPEGVPNAADIYSKAFDGYQDPNEELFYHLPIGGAKVMADRRGPLDPNSVKAITSYLHANKESLEFLDKAVTIEHCRYDLNFSLAMMPNPYSNDMKKCMYLLARQTMLLAHQGDGDAAVKSIARQLALGESLKKEPILFSQLVRMACIGLSRESVEYTLNRTTLNDEQLTGLQQQLSQVYQDDPMATGLIGARCDAISYTNNPQQSGLPTILSGLLRITGISDRNILMSLELIGQYIDALKLPAQQRFTRCREISVELDDLSFFYSLTMMGMFSWEEIVQMDLRVAAGVDCTRVALAIERYRLAKGSLPKELADLAPRYIDKVPIDPFDGKPLRYKLTEPGYIVYSIGMDGTDEGGLEKDKIAQKADPHDWPFIVEH